MGAILQTDASAAIVPAWPTRDAVLEHGAGSFLINKSRQHELYVEDLTAMDVVFNNLQ